LDLYGTLRKQYSRLKSLYRSKRTPPLSRVRRISHVFPPKDTRLVAMTFDDGPTCAPSRPLSDTGITQLIIEAMAAYGASGTFNVIGSTSENYPDKEGKPGSFKWSGVRYDHYPRFGHDTAAGAANQGRLVETLIAQGHEISNHGYRHVAFGPERIVYGSRAHFTNSHEVTEDLARLHNLLTDDFGYTIKLARPPHYIDKIPDGFTSYDIYEQLGYQYLGASFDGGGWRASTGNFQEDVESMVEPLRKALKENPDSLSGHIIFEKDGYNMSLEAPAAFALPEKLKLLTSYDYRIVTVSELLQLSQFADVGPSSDTYEAIMFLTNMGKPVVYRDNTFRGNNAARLGEVMIWLGPQHTPQGLAKAGHKSKHARFASDVSRSKTPVSPKVLLDIAAQNGLSVPDTWKQSMQNPVPRWQAVLIAAEILS